MSDSDSNSIYNLFYQRIIGSKVLLGQKFFTYKSREIQFIVEEIKGKGNSGLILDLGCSTGHYTRKLAAVFGAEHVEGADISKKSIDRCRRNNPNLNFHHIENDFYENQKGKYEYVLLSHVLEHRDDPIDILTSIRGLLKKSGILILCVPQERIRGDSALPENIYNLIRLKFENVHRKKHSLETLEKLLTTVGLKKYRYRYIHAFKAKKDCKSLLNHSLVVCAETILN